MKQDEINKMAKERFENGMRENLPHIKFSGYIRSAMNMSCECSKCGYKWNRSPNQFYRDNKWRDCPNCMKVNSEQRQDNDALRNEILKKYPDMNIITTLITTKRDSILFTFKNNAEIVYRMNISQLLKDGERTFVRYWDTEIYIKELQKINPNIECLGVFTNFNQKILHHCTIHNEYLYIDPAHALRGQGCKMCKLEKIGNAKRKSVNDYTRQLHMLNPNIELDECYVSGNKPTRHRCKKCGFRWNPYPCNLLKDARCPMCESVSSKGENEISSILDKNNVDYIPQHRFDDCRNIKPLPFDFYIKGKNTCIEFQGKQHYEPVQFGGISEEVANENLIEVRQRDLIKSNFCRSENIRLIVIPYWDFNNIEKILTSEKII